ncbi:MAG: hypothetical protein ACUVV4_04815 [Candidatus Bathyarchaeia archaeon]
MAPRTRQPPIRCFTLRDILEYSEDDPEIVEAKKAIEGYDKVLKILSRRKEGGYWELADQPYTPKYRSTYWVIMVLSQLGVDVRNRQLGRPVISLNGFSVRMADSQSIMKRLQETSICLKRRRL